MTNSDGSSPEVLESKEQWEERSRIVLTPVAAPASSACWRRRRDVAGGRPPPGGTEASRRFLWDSDLFGGFGHRGVVVVPSATLGTGLFGCFWDWPVTALDATGVLAEPSSDVFRPFGFWFITTGIVTLVGTVAALRVHLGVVAVTFCAGTASLIAAAGYMSGNVTLQHAAGADFFAAATFAVYTGSALMLEQMWHRPVLWIGKTRLTRSPSSSPSHPIEYKHGMPGSRIG